MRAVIQRVASASVEVDGALVSSIGRGILVLVGVAHGDGPADVDWVARKLLSARLFPAPSSSSSPSSGEGGAEEESGGGGGGGGSGGGAPPRWSASVSDLPDGEILCVSQFTLLGSLKKGTKPDFKAAAAPAEALETYGALLDRLREGFREPRKVKDGVFGAMMKVSLVNDGPVTLTIDSREGRGSSGGSSG